MGHNEKLGDVYLDVTQRHDPPTQETDATKFALLIYQTKDYNPASLGYAFRHLSPTNLNGFPSLPTSGGIGPPLPSFFLDDPRPRMYGDTECSADSPRGT
jgi:hypothetical protein